MESKLIFNKAALWDIMKPWRKTKRRLQELPMTGGGQKMSKSGPQKINSKYKPSAHF